MNEFQQALDKETKQAYKDLVVDSLRGSEFLQAIHKAYQDKWNALPWYKKKYKRLQGWIYWKRRAVGEWIAGDKFSE